MSGDKYPFFDVSEKDAAPLFTTKMQENAHVGCLRGVFDNGGISVSWIKGNEVLKTPAFETELRDLFETLQRDGPLEDLPEPDFNYLYRKKKKAKTKER